MPICTYQYYFGSGENAALGKCGPGGGLEILTENVGHGGVTGGFSRGSRVVLRWFSGGSRVVLGWFSGWHSRTKHIQSQEIIMPEASTKKRVWKQGPILHEMMFRLHETTVSTSASKLSKAGLLGFTWPWGVRTGV